MYCTAQGLGPGCNTLCDDLQEDYLSAGFNSVSITERALQDEMWPLMSAHVLAAWAVTSWQDGATPVGASQLSDLRGETACLSPCISW